MPGPDVIIHLTGVQGEFNTCTVTALVPWRLHKADGAPADHEIYSTVTLVYRDVKELKIKRSDHQRMYDWRQPLYFIIESQDQYQKWGHICWITQQSEWNIDSAAIHAHTAVSSCTISKPFLPNQFLSSTATISHQTRSNYGNLRGTNKHLEGKPLEYKRGDAGNHVSRSLQKHIPCDLG